MKKHSLRNTVSWSVALPKMIFYPDTVSETLAIISVHQWFPFPWPISSDVYQVKYRLFRMSGVLLAALLTGCLNTANNEVVVYTALDKEFSQPILERVQQELGVTIRPKFDVESNKTVGLVNDLIQHRRRPRADIFWNNEILHTLRLQRLGILEVYQSPAAANFPPNYRAADGAWTGFAARARVFIVNTDLLPGLADRPSSFFDLADPQWAGKCGMAKPLFGTSATHAAVMFDRLGVEVATQWYRQFQSNAVVEGGNRQVAIKVGRGELAFGLTDTDDAMLEIDRGNPVVILYPDQAESQAGTLLIPNTISLIANGPHPQQARRVIDRLLQADIETKLADGASAQFPLNPEVTASSRASPPKLLKMMDVDFDSAAEKWEQTAAVLTKIFQ